MNILAKIFKESYQFLSPPESIELSLDEFFDMFENFINYNLTNRAFSMWFKNEAETLNHLCHSFSEITGNKISGEHLFNLMKKKLEIQNLQFQADLIETEVEKEIKK